MKKTVKVLALAIASFAVAQSASAQSVSATSNATGTIVSPLTITWLTDMRFGNMAVTPTSGTVVMAPTSGSGGRTATGGVSLPGVTGTVSAASYTVTGEGGDTYTITLPSSASTLADGSSHTMTLDSWTNNFGSTHTFSGTGFSTETLYVGGTLHIAGSQTPGVYALTTGGSGVFSVTLNY